MTSPRLRRRALVYFLSVSLPVLVGTRPGLAATKTFVAYSMQAAQTRVQNAAGRPPAIRRNDPELSNLGGITVPWAVVLDERNGDWVLIGEDNPSALPLTLDDWAVALRARFSDPARDPGVSIEPPTCMRTGTCTGSATQDVVFYAGVGQTHFGDVCYQADWLLKRIAFGLENPRVPGLPSVLGILADEYRGIPRPGSSALDGMNRLWFYPVASQVSVTSNVVLLEALQMAVFSESIDEPGKPVTNSRQVPALASAADRFARTCTNNYEKLASAWPVLRSLQGLTRLAALAKGLSQIENKRRLDYWLRDFQVERIRSPKRVPVLRSSRVGASLLVLRGGVTLLALALRVQEGDLDALRSLALKVRPSAKALSWSFGMEMDGERIRRVGVPTTTKGSANLREVALLYAHAVQLERQRQYDAAIRTWDRIVAVVPEWVGAYNNRGLIHLSQGRSKQAMADFERASRLAPKVPQVYYNRGNGYLELGELDRALADYNRAIKLNPDYANAFHNRGLLHVKRKHYPAAIADFERVIAIEPQVDEGYYGRGRVYDEMGRRDDALRDYTKAIECNPAAKEAYSNRGAIFAERGNHALALADFDKALELDPALATAHNGRGLILYLSKQPDKAVEEFNKAIALEPKTADFYDNRGVAQVSLARLGLATRDFRRALDLDPARPGTWRNLCKAHRMAGEGALAVKVCDEAVRWERALAQAHATTAGGSARESAADAELGRGADAKLGNEPPRGKASKSQCLSLVDAIDRTRLLPQTFVVSPNGIRFAYASLEGNEQGHVVVDGVRGKKYPSVAGAPAFSADSKHVVYVAGDEHDRWFVVVDGEESSSKHPSLGGKASIANPVFAPDGSSLSYIRFAQADGRSSSSVVTDGRQGAEYDGVAQLTYSPDGGRVAYVAQAGRGWRMVVDGHEGQLHEGTHSESLVFSANSRRVAYAAFDGSEHFVVVDGKQGQAYSDVGNPVFSPDGKKVAYVAAARREHVLVLNDREWLRYDRIDPKSLTFSQDSAHFAFKASIANVWVVVVDGKAEGRYGRVGRLVYDPTGAHLAYAACYRCGGESWSGGFVVMDGKKVSAEYDGLDERLVFSPDGRSLAFAAKRGAAEFVVTNGQEGKAYDAVMPASLTFSPRATHLVYAAASDRRAGAFIVAAGSEGRLFDCVTPLGWSGDHLAQGGRVLFAGEDVFHYLACVETKVHLVTESLPVGRCQATPQGSSMSSPDRRKEK